MTREEMGRRAWEYRVPMMRLAASMLNSWHDAEDAVSDALVKAMASAETLRDETRLKPWLMSIVAHGCQDLLRQRKREQPTDTLPEAAALTPLGEDSLLIKLRTLNPKQAQVLALYYYEGCLAREIAQILRVPLSTVLMRLKRGRAALKALYEEEGGRAE